MKHLAKIAAAAVITLGFGTLSVSAAYSRREIRQGRRHYYYR